VPTHRRPIGYVFQEASLFPHLTVLGNLRYGQRRSRGRTPIGGPRFSLEHAIELLGIGHLLKRKPAACPAASASASASPGRWRSTRGCC
jgi:molybdate transport system ATP-binding protein